MILTCALWSCFQLWMMQGQIQEQKGDIAAARDIYNKGVSTSSLCVRLLCHYSVLAFGMFCMEF